MIIEIDNEKGDKEAIDLFHGIENIYITGVGINEICVPKDAEQLTKLIKVLEEIVERRLT